MIKAEYTDIEEASKVKRKGIEAEYTGLEEVNEVNLIRDYEQV